MLSQANHKFQMYLGLTKSMCSRPPSKALDIVSRALRPRRTSPSAISVSIDSLSQCSIKEPVRESPFLHIPTVRSGVKEVDTLFFASLFGHHRQ